YYSLFSSSLVSPFQGACLNILLTSLKMSSVPSSVFIRPLLCHPEESSLAPSNMRVHHILNVTREIDNFFPGMFNYLNIRVYDDEKTDLLKHWDNTFKYISKARKEGSKVLVHCKMGVSRSASVVIAYAMKAYNWDFKEAFEYVKQKRNCIKPNSSFICQLETYQGILDAMKNREKLQRSKSETNLKSPGLVAKAEQRAGCGGMRSTTRQETVSGPESLQCSQLLGVDWVTSSGEELSKNGSRPKSWSPDNSTTAMLFLGNVAGPTSVSLEQLNLESSSPVKQDVGNTSTYLQQTKTTEPTSPILPCTDISEATRNCNLNVRMPCGNGQAYSVSQNKVVYLPASCCQEEVVVPSVKHRVNELELQSTNINGASNRKISLDRKGLVLNLTNQFESSTSKPGSPTTPEDELNTKEVEEDEHTAQAQTKLAPQMLTAVLVKKEIWDPGEKESPTVYAVEPMSQPSVPSNSDRLVWTTPEVAQEIKAEDVIYVSELKLGETDSAKVSRTLSRREGDPFSAQLDRVFEREERKQQRTVIPATPPPPPLIPPCVTELCSEPSNRECPSRQSSWSSYDSAVVLGFQGEAREAPSRQSSWGSGDTRWTYGGTLPSRNSSWGSYDMRPPMQYVNERGEKQQMQSNLDDLLISSSSGMFPYDRDEIPWYPGTVKRTKQKLEEGASMVKRMCSDSQQRSESPLVNSQENRPLESAPGMNVKIHGPRPYRSPSSDRLLPNTGFSFPSSDPHACDVHSEDQSHAMVHYASSPTLCSHHSISHESDDSMSTSPGSADKMASSQPNITFLDSMRTNYEGEVNVPSVCSLSVSAPTTSSISLVEGIEPMTPPSHSLPSVSSACLSGESVNEASPCIVSTTQCKSVKQHKRALENLNTRRCVSVDSSGESTDSQKSVSGLVKNLKKEFEAKSVNKPEKCNIATEISTNENDQRRGLDGAKARSLPSSPVSTHPEVKSPCSPSPSPASTVEDLSVKVLVGKYEVSKPDSPPLASRKTETLTRKTSQQPPVPLRKSSLEILQNNANKQSSLLVHNLRNGNEGPNSRPPMAPHVVRGPSPSVVMASVMAKAANKKQQQGKTHPLACLPRHTNTVYNTM
ncbi:hypothetical protein L9F63_001758, partial [Diploptera punctata]